MEFWSNSHPRWCRLLDLILYLLLEKYYNNIFNTNIEIIISWASFTSAVLCLYMISFYIPKPYCIWLSTFRFMYMNKIILLTLTMSNWMYTWSISFQEKDAIIQKSRSDAKPMHTVSNWFSSLIDPGRQGEMMNPIPIVKSLSKSIKHSCNERFTLYWIKSKHGDILNHYASIIICYLALGN